MTYNFAKKYQDGIANKDNFFFNTIAVFKPIEYVPTREADYNSSNYYSGEISSSYWYTDEGVIRYSDHWGNDIATCDWKLEGYPLEYARVTLTKQLYGFCKWEDFVEKISIMDDHNGQPFISTFNNTLSKYTFLVDNDTVIHWEDVYTLDDYNNNRKPIKHVKHAGIPKYSLQENYDEYEKPITREDIETVQKIPEKSINDFTSNEIISTQKWAHKFYKQLGAKSPFFRAWFGDWREFDTTLIKIARTVNANNQRPYQVKNDDTSWDIQVSGKINDETTVHQSKASKYAVSYLSYLDDIIKNAVLLETETLKNKKSYNSLLMHSLYSVADIGNGAEVLKLNVEEIYNPNSSNTIKRAYKLINIEKQQSGVTGSGVTPSLSTQTVDIKTISDLYSYVKSKDAKFNHKSANSKLLNDDGTPKKFYHGTSDNFYEFNTDEISFREGSFLFAENIEDAESYGNRVISAYLSAKNLADYDNQPSEFYRLENKKAQVAWLKQKGYDGWYADFDSDGWGEVSVFYPNQIKSADENIGTFDSKSDDIRYSLQENEETTLAHEELLKENEELKKANQILSEEFKLTNGHKMGTKAREELRRRSKRFLKQWKSTYNADEYTERVMNVFEYLSTDNPDTDKALNSLAAIGKDVITQTSIKSDFVTELQSNT